jgi:hypothetical protein
VHGKNGILVKLATAALALPEEIVRKALYPVVGKRTLEDIIAEAKANEKEFNTRVRTKLRGSYSHHYRRGLPKLLKAVTFRSSNEAFQPVMDALALLAGTPILRPTSTTRAGGVAQGGTAAGDLGGGRQHLAQPRPRSAGRLRGQPGRALPGAVQAPRSGRLRRRPAEAARRRPGPATTRS